MKDDGWQHKGALEVIDNKFKVRPVDNMVCISPAMFTYRVQGQTDEEWGVTRAEGHDKKERHKEVDGGYDSGSQNLSSVKNGMRTKAWWVTDQKAVGLMRLNNCGSWKTG